MSAPTSIGSFTDSGSFTSLKQYGTFDNNARLYFGTNQSAAIQTQATAIPEIINTDFPANSPSHLAKLEAVFAQARNRYQEDTKQMEVVNNLANLSNFVDKTVNKEDSRLSTLRTRTFSDVHKMRESYMMKKYQIAQTQFVSGIVQFTLFVLLACGFLYMYSLHPDQPISKTLAMGIIAGILLIYLVIVVLYVKQSMIRRKDDWNKFYFGNMEGKNGSSCS